MASLPVAAAPSSSPCDACISGCCRGFNLVIQSFDAWRIARDLKLPIADFADLLWTDKPGDEARLTLDTTHPERSYRLLLRKVPEPQPGFPARCVFLVTAGTRGRCGIYASRPTMCRIYPTMYRGGLLGASAGKFCPPGSWQVESIDVPLGRARHLFRRRQAAIEERLVLAWNAHALREGGRRAREEYFRYLVQVFSELQRRRPEWLAELEPGEPEQPTAQLAAEVDRLLADLGFPVPEHAPPPASSPPPAALDAHDPDASRDEHAGGQHGEEQPAQPQGAPGGQPG